MTESFRALQLLLVTDDLAVTNGAVATLEDAGYEVTWSRVDSITAFFANAVPTLDAILADIDLPSFCVIDALEYLRAQDVDVPLIALSGMLTEDSAVTVLTRGAADYVVKDRLTRLPATVVSAIEHRRVAAERTTAEAARRRDDESFMHVFENDAVGMALIEGPSGRLRRVNAALCAMSGFSEDELLQFTAAELSDADDVSSQRPSIVEKLGGGASVRAARRCRRKDGSWLRVAFSLTPFTDNMGFLVVEDTSAQHEAQDALRASREQARRVYEHSPIGMCVIDPETRIVSVNPALCRLFGYTEEEFLKLAPQAVFHPDEGAKRPGAFADARDDWTSTHSAELRCMTKGGREILISATWSYFRDPEGRDRSFAVVQDVTAQRAAEEALRASEQLFRELFVNSPLPMAISEPGRRYHAVNPALCRMLGYTETELIELGPADVSHPDDFKQQQPLVAEAQRSRQPIQVERRLRTKDGQTLMVRGVAASFITDPQGCELVVTIMEDITERRQIEEERARLASIVSLSTDAIVSRRVDGVITHWNEGARRLYGYEHDEIVGRHVNVLIPLDRRAEESELLRRVALGERIDHYQTERIHKDGHSLTVDLSLSPMADAAGKIVGVAALSRDIGAQLRAEAMFRWLIDSAPDAMVCVAPDGLIAIVNAQAERLFGYDRAELLGQPVEILVPDTERSEHPGRRSWYLDDSLRSPMAAGLPLSARRRDGSEFPTEISLSTIHTDSGILVSAAIRDVTEQREAARRLEIAHCELDLRATELDRSNHDLEEFAYVASHDLKEPLRAVRGFSQLLERHYAGRLDARADEYLGFITDGASRMQSLIDDLLTYSRVGASTTPHSFPLRSVVDDALANLGGAIESDTRIDIDELPNVVADPGQMTQLMQNLIGNALKFRAEEPSVVRVTAEPDADGWIITISDNGIGIDPRFADQIFTVFQRLHSREEYAGTGVGLAICKKLVDRWGGRIWVESELGGGAAFRFTIPGAPR